jgi:hypothetical protein
MDLDNQLGYRIQSAHLHRPTVNTLSKQPQEFFLGIQEVNDRISVFNIPHRMDF